MSDNYLEMLLKELQKNGVSLRKIPFNTDKFTVDELETEAIRMESFNFLDFSEHDKVFADKIAELKSEITSLESHMSRLRERCMDGARRNFDRGNYGCLTIVNRNGDLGTESEKLKQRIAELESKNNQLTESILRKETKIHELESKETSDLPFDPLECANYLINATYERETNGIERTFYNLPEKVNSDRYTVDDLEQIAEHLLIYCKHNKE